MSINKNSIDDINVQDKVTDSIEINDVNDFDDDDDMLDGYNTRSEQTFSSDIKTPTYHTEERLSNKFLTLLVRNIHEKSDIIDTIYGVRIEGGTTRIGDSTNIVL
ncbi:hypothetical protein DD595_25375 [Enterobacter cloacae complex sp. 4DZ3-17B2]|uniref:hypothetical protein n=1 Tax=Enterobacter cloacae complex sp. 4DZ3-17B2 TaxID=2511990 RepID=UPI00101396A3|nr:hypothetical protein [Enterobacter cloacae complex sp. 4DZ3-17B2]RYA71082.1 hypothetical protein DD595_25375 [Enterobacter cloacae complex sp. 4DZ3-17B2]